MESEIQKEEVREKNVGVKKKGTKKKILIIILCIIAVVIIFLGVYFNYLGNPKRIVGNAIDTITTKMKKSLSSSRSIDLGDQYTLSSDVKLNIESDYLDLLSSYNDSYQPYIRLVQNLSKTENHYDFIQDKKNKQLLFHFGSTLNNEELIQAKYYVEKGQYYYYIKDFLDTYVNGGKNNYFESLNEDATSDNILYIYDLCIQSLKNNLEDRYFTKTSDTITINNKQEKVSKITFTIDNKVLLELANHILTDLKKDTKANKILTEMDPDFKNSKVEESEKYLKDGEKIFFHVFVNPITFEERKYEVAYQTTDTVYSLSYVIDGDLQIKENNKLLSTIQLKVTKDTVTANILDANNQKLGSVTLVVDGYNSTLDASAVVQNAVVSFHLTNNCKEINKNKEYQMNSVSTIKVEYNNTTLAKMEITVQSSLKDTAVIQEDVSKAVSESSLEGKDEIFQEKLTNIFVKLMS